MSCVTSKAVFLSWRGLRTTAGGKVPSQEQALANTVREDLRWLSRGAQARRTKSKGRDSRERK